MSVGDVVAQQRHTDRLTLVIQDVDLARVLLVPEQVVPVRRHGVDPVSAIGDTGRVDGVRDGVLSTLVVPGVEILRPDVFEVGQVAVVQRLQQFAVDHLAQDTRTGKHQVKRRARLVQLREHLVVVVVRRHLDLDVVLLAEGLHHPRGHVVGVVEDLEDATRLRSRPVFDRRVAVLDRQCHRIVRARQRVGRGATLLVGCRRLVVACGQQRRRADTDGQPQAAAQHISPGKLRPRPPVP